VEASGGSKPHRFSPSVIVVVLAAALAITACTPLISAKDTTTTAIEPTATTVPATDANGKLLPPRREDRSAVAADVLTPVDGFTEAATPPDTASDLLIAIDAWLPPDLVAGDAEIVYSDAAGAYVAVVSVIPNLTWRGDPGFVPDVIEAVTGAEPGSPSTGVFTAQAPGGAVLHLWSSGDGFVIASSLDSDAAVTYLSGLERTRQPNPSWSSGDCLFLDETETLPYAPFPRDVVVSCSGAHNAEVLIGFTQGTDSEAFDADAIEYQRNYECDQAYNEAFGDQLTHSPGLVTYMPDEDEWARGDRYLACVVIIDRNEGRQVFSGPMAGLDDLDFNPDVGSCLLGSLPADTVECSSPHVYQFVGVATVDSDTWPDGDSTLFDDACAPLVDTLESGPGPLAVFPIGLGSYAFENGDRTVRCMAFATVDGFLVDVLGSFNGAWRVLGTDGVPTSTVHGRKFTVDSSQSTVREAVPTVQGAQRARLGKDSLSDCQLGTVNCLLFLL
jgi:hypothetical protein